MIEGPKCKNVGKTASMPKANSGQRSVTLADVAKLAGVSKKSVSRVVNKEAHVSKDLRIKVEKVISQLNYQPDRQARSLRSGRSYTLVFLYENPASYFVISVIDGIRKTCQENGYELLIHETPQHGKGIVRNTLDAIDKLRPDGVVMMPPLSDDPRLISALDAHNIPIARIAPADGNERPADIVTTDEEAGWAMADHFLKLGHKSIGFIAGDPDHLAMQARQIGLEQRLKRSDAQNVQVKIVQGSNTFESGKIAAAQLISDDNPPTAIFSANDDMAVGAIYELHERNIRIPEDIAIAGFDNTILASRVWPGLTTVHQPVTEMGALAAEKLLQMIAGHEVEKAMPLPTQLVIRRSTQPE